MDWRGFRPGAIVWFPVSVPGALFFASLGRLWPLADADLTLPRETLVRRAFRIASKSSADLMVVHVVRGDGLSGVSAPQMGRVRDVATSLGATVHTVVGDDVATALLDFARERNATQLVLAELMAHLGYERFGIQGYDTGGWVGPAIGRHVPDRVIGMALTHRHDPTLEATTDTDDGRQPRGAVTLPPTVGLLA